MVLLGQFSKFRAEAYQSALGDSVGDERVTPFQRTLTTATGVRVYHFKDPKEMEAQAIQRTADWMMQQMGEADPQRFYSFGSGAGIRAPKSWKRGQPSLPTQERELILDDLIEGRGRVSPGMRGDPEPGELDILDLLERQERRRARER